MHDWVNNKIDLVHGLQVGEERTSRLMTTIYETYHDSPKIRYIGLCIYTTPPVVFQNKTDRVKSGLFDMREVLE